DAIAGPQDCGSLRSGRPRDPQPGSEVIAVRIVSAARESVITDWNERPRAGIVYIGSIGGIDRGRIVLVSQTRQQREIGTQSQAILGEEGVAAGAKVLRIIQPRAAAYAGKALQQLGQRIAREAEKVDKAAGL